MFEIFSLLTLAIPRGLWYDIKENPPQIRGRKEVTDEFYENERK